MGLKVQDYYCYSLPTSMAPIFSAQVVYQNQSHKVSSLRWKNGMQWIGQLVESRGSGKYIQLKSLNRGYKEAEQTEVQNRDPEKSSAFRAHS